nr:hypothetical protein [Pantoea vagans]
MAKITEALLRDILQAVGGAQKYRGLWSLYDAAPPDAESARVD